MKISVALTLAATHAAARNLNMASFSDIHLFTDYDATTDASGYCWDYSEPADLVAYFGRWGCDVPVRTARLLLQ